MINKWEDEEFCMEQVKKNGLKLAYVVNQTEEICIEAIKQNAFSLKYVKDKTPTILNIAQEQTEKQLTRFWEHAPEWLYPDKPSKKVEVSYQQIKDSYKEFEEKDEKNDNIDRESYHKKLRENYEKRKAKEREEYYKKIAKNEKEK